MKKDKTFIQISRTTWERLNKMKKAGDSFDDLIVELLDKNETNEKKDGECGETN